MKREGLIAGQAHGERIKPHCPPAGYGGLHQYIFAHLTGDAIRRLVKDDGQENDALKQASLKGARFAKAIYHVWPDFKVSMLTNKSVSTVKCDAARTSFGAYGQDVVWAVLDTGVDSKHPHFDLHKNLDLEPPLRAFDFTTTDEVVDQDPNGHGTHVAGIIAGEMKKPAAGEPAEMLGRAAVRTRNENGKADYSVVKIESISGMAPRCKIVNMRVLDAKGIGEVSSIITALAKVQEINSNGRHLLIHGVNLSLGNDFEPEWFACGQSPLCVEVDRLVKSGVVVVVAAGNAGYGTLTTAMSGSRRVGMQLTVRDPGNAELAITVGSTHRDMPHTYGVSYFSSKGPTGDGRLKPDVVAPGEKIISCAAKVTRDDLVKSGCSECSYVEKSGTSMAAPHVSGVIAAFLSVRREFIGKPEKLKEIFVSTATDLGRERYFQGSGLVDLMRAIQSI
jgi:serine protease AprX